MWPAGGEADAPLGWSAVDPSQLRQALGQRLGERAGAVSLTGDGGRAVVVGASAESFLGKEFGAGTVQMLAHVGQDSTGQRGGTEGVKIHQIS